MLTNIGQQATQKLVRKNKDQHSSTLDALYQIWNSHHIGGERNFGKVLDIFMLKVSEIKTAM